MQVTRKVDRIENASLPEKNKDKNILLSTMKRVLLGDGSINTAEIRKCNDALVPLSKPVFRCSRSLFKFCVIVLEAVRRREAESYVCKNNTT